MSGYCLMFISIRACITKRIDYILCSTNHFDTLHNFSVGEKDVSDHFPLQCTSTCTRDNEDLCVQDTAHLTPQSLRAYHRYRWDEDKRHGCMYAFPNMYVFTQNVTKNNFIHKLFCSLQQHW